MSNFDAVRNFDDAPGSMLVPMNVAEVVLARSRASIYRHVRRGDLPLVKIGCSSRFRVADLRRLIGG